MVNYLLPILIGSGVGVRPIVCLSAGVNLVASDEDIGIENAECFELVE